VSLALVALALTALCGAAREEETRFGLSDEARGLGVGLILGEPTGIAAAWRGQGRSFMDLAVAWSVTNDRLHLQADYLHTLATFQDRLAPKISMPFYVGVGPRLRLGEDEAWSKTEHALFGVRVPVGLGVNGDGVPVDGFLELAPVVGLYPETRFELDACLGARVYFARR